MESLWSNLNQLVFLAQQGGQGAGGGGGGDGIIQMLGMFVPLALVFYLLIWRPESKRRKERQETLNALKTKDEVVTIGGMFGTVVKVDKDDVTLLVDQKNNIRLRFRRSAIEGITTSSPLQEEPKQKQKK